MSYNEMNQFESIITSIRNILRIEGITGLDSINHCIAFIIVRYLTIEKCTEFQIPLEFAFENFLKNSDGSLIDDQTAIGKFYNKNAEIDCLYCYLHDKLNFNSFKFKINAPLNFLNIYKKLADIDINSLYNRIDIVGAIYELHLKTGTTGSGMRDLGQYFTNREVIKYMIKLCNPILKLNGEIETILDPSMGTGGFLSMSIKHLNKNHPDINWDINKDRIYGFDVDETVKDLSVLNALLESGKIFSKTLVKNDTLHNDFMISNNVLIDKVDIILANEPFGLKNIIHKNVCKRIKDLKIDGTKAEPLFLQLMMQSLNEGGRCAVIVPDGVLFNEAKLHKLTRKYLCNNLRLAKVISLEDGLFLNTGVKSSILFFINDGKTVDIEFCKIKLSNNEIIEESIIKVGIDQIILNDYSLFVNKYNIIKEEQIKGLEYMRLGDICEIQSNGLRNSSEGRNEGKYPLFYCSILGHLWIDEFDYDDESIIINTTNGSGKCEVYYCKGKFSVAQSTVRFKSNKSNVLTKYMFYYLKINKNIIEDKFHGANQKQLTRRELIEIQIPIPDLPLQLQIADALDNIYEIIESNNKLIKNYEKIKKSIIYFHIFNIDKKKLGDIVDIQDGYEFKNNEITSDSNNVPLIRATYIQNKNITDYINEDIKYDKYKIVYGDIIMSQVGNVGNVCKYKEIKFGYNKRNAFRIRSKEISNDYVYNFLLTDMFKNQILTVGSIVQFMSIPNIKNLLIPVPTKEIQDQIVKECDYYDNLIQILTDENNRLLNNNIIELAFNSTQTNNIEDDLVVDEEPKIIKHNKIITKNTKTTGYKNLSK